MNGSAGGGGGRGVSVGGDDMAFGVGSMVVGSVKVGHR